MKYFLFILSVALLMCACNDNKKENDTHTTSPAAGLNNEPPQNLSGCYRTIIGKDTAHLTLEFKGSIVKGRLSYNRFEKDDNEGDLQGIIESNKIRAWFKFQSEGILSVREIFFKINGDNLEEGFGDVSMRSDTVYFRYPAAVQYEGNHPYVKISCN